MKITNDFDFYIALEDIGKYSPDEILERYEVKGFYRRLMVQQKVKMLEKGTSFIPFVMGKITWVVFFVLLLLALIFKVLYFRSDMAIYLFIALKRVYKQSFFVTSLKFIFILFCHFPLFLFGIMLTFIGSFLIF